MLGVGIGLPQVALWNRRGAAAFSPASLFANGEQGWWFDPSNSATLFQDAAGTTPVTAVEQPVGLQLDLSKGLVLDPELCTDPSFNNPSAWYVAAGGWVVSNGEATATASNGYLGQALGLSVIGASRYFECVVTITSYTAGTLRFFAGAGGSNRSAPMTAAGTYRLRVLSDISGLQIGVVGQSFTGVIDNISFKEVAGNHRSQSTSANRPVVSARVNLLTNTVAMTGGTWLTSNVTPTANSIVAPDGTTTGELVTATGGSTFHWRANGFVTTPSTGNTFTVNLARGTQRYIAVIVGDTSSNRFGCTVDTTTWQIVSSGINGSGVLTSASIAANTKNNSWYDVTISGTSGTSNAVYVATRDSAAWDGNTLAASAAGGTWYNWGFDLRPTNQGVGLPAYQRVNTSTDYDSTGFPIYIKPNGSNQFMVTNSINFTATDKMTVWQGVRKLSDAAIGVLMELNNSATNGTFTLTTSGQASAGAKYGSYLKGSALIYSDTAASYPAPLTNVLTLISDIAQPTAATEQAMRINGAAVALTTVGADAGTGNFGNYPTYFYSRAGTSIFFNGNDYGSIARGAASTAAQITAGETYINSKTKAFA